MGKRPLNFERCGKWIKKYKYAVLVLLIGIILLLWPTKSSQNKSSAPSDSGKETQSEQAQATDLDNLQEQLEKVLSQVEGAGAVRVMLTLKTGTQYQYQTDLTQEESKDDTSEKHNTTRSTVIVSTGNAQQQGMITQTICPTYQGAVVVSEGADSASVKLNLVNAVSSLTGLSTDKITVIKMKGN